MHFFSAVLLATTLFFTTAHCKRSSNEKKYYLAVCALFQNEAPYLKEWIEFHKLIGVEHFYLYNHRSNDAYKKVLSPYIKEGRVTLRNWTQDYKSGNIGEFDKIQRDIYKDALKVTRGKVKWLAFIDVDEFLFPVEQEKLPTLLKQYEKYPGLFVNWQMFGTSHVQTIPPRKLMIETLIRKSVQDYHWNKRVKSIVRPSVTKEALNPHYFRYHNRAKAVNTDCVAFQSDFSPYIAVDKVRINHYYTRDEQHFFNVKVPRRIRWYNEYEWQSWFEDLNAVEDDAILKYVDKLKKRVFP